MLEASKLQMPPYTATFSGGLNGVCTRQTVAIGLLFCTVKLISF